MGKFINTNFMFYLRNAEHTYLALEANPTQQAVILSDFKGRSKQTWFMDNQCRIRTKLSQIDPQDNVLNLRPEKAMGVTSKLHERFFFQRVTQLPREKFSYEGVPQLEHKYDEQVHPYHSIYRIINNNGMCIACRYGMISNGAQCALEQVELDKTSQMWFIDCLPSYLRQTENSIGGSGNRTYAKGITEKAVKDQEDIIKRLIKDEKKANSNIVNQDVLILPNKLFWKGVSSLFSLVKGARYLTQECTGSNLSNYLSGGLVQPSIISYCHKDLGIAMPWLKMNVARFKDAQSNEAIGHIIDKLPEKQLVQLFIHMLTDRLISNWDTHQLQFGFDIKTQDLVSFDKEWAFERFSLNDEQTEKALQLDFDKDIWKKESVMNRQNFFYVYIPLTRKIRERQVTFDISHPLLVAFYDRCKNIPYSLVEKLCWEYASVTYPKRPYQFINLVYTRIIDIRRAVHNYFLWEYEDEQDKSSIPQSDSEFSWQI
eukprot:CAMPEP_0117429950 /NCGR_PEP_ID=MMETSP0758-20121206/9482_1 /TAXON_ID=63605 /ORGANISM="Percolomonas cosmopolitus, Strain AE-1 (ATCC 50343)" /LENGTH=484 /DNA_ID=CAMNT_0005217467 /DNA_START=516 /DNA_END=1970 /DNA_ORIENTATION=+